MDLDLVQCRLHTGGVDDRPQVFLLEVRDTHGASPAVGLELEHRPPGRHVIGRLGHGPVDEEEVDGLDLQILQRLSE